MRPRQAGRAALLALVIAGPLAGQASPVIPGSDIRISVMTMGVGAEVWERFGHNAIMVENATIGTSLDYNYGMFSFHQENFLLRFLQGRMRYWMGVEDTETDVPRYVRAERAVWRQVLNLTPAQRLEVQRLLELNALPENRFYRYDYYLDNCSTRVRDVIDRVVGGALHEYADTLSGTTFRFHTLRLTAHNVPLYTGLLLALGHAADRPITRWEEMFLPLKLHAYLREVRVRGPDGALVPLVVAEDTLAASTRYQVPDRPPAWWPWYLLAGLVLGGLCWWGGRRGGVSPGARWTLLILGTLWAFVTGLAGAILAGLWAFTDHAIAARNENVLQATVVALALAVALPRAVRGGPGAGPMARGLAVLVGGLSVAGLLLKVLPAFYQANWEILALFIPANVGLMLGVLAVTRGAGRG